MFFKLKNQAVNASGRLAAALFVALLLTPYVGEAAGEPEEKRQSPPPRDLTYNHHQYNYPHQLPADYVFRTSRIFSPWELRHGSDAKRAPEGTGERQQEGEEAMTRAFSEAKITALVRELLRGGRHDIRDGYTLAVSPPVNLGDLYATSSFGRLLGERLLGELQRAGVEVIDVRRTPAMLIHERHGEYGLSRDMDELSYVLNAQAVLVGTYTVGEGRVLVELRVLDNQDGRILTSAGRNFDMDREIATLLADESRPPRPATPVEVR